MKRYKTVDEYIENSQHREELKQLREIIIHTSLRETVKWGSPVYTFNGKNVVGLGSFKSYVGIWFFQGVFLKDDDKVLINAQEGKTKALRQWRFESVEEINDKLITKYIEEAIENARQGKEIKPEKNKPLVIPDELQTALKENRALMDSFNQLSLSKQREYVEYITEAKREETRLKRLEKSIPMILGGKGLNDRYR